VTELLTATVNGVPVGCVYALLAVGLVVTYSTSGVFNLALGVQAYASALLYYVLVVEHGWSTWLAFLVAVLALGPALGFCLDRFLFRFLRRAGTTVSLVAAIGLLVGLPSVLAFIFGGRPRYRPPSIGIGPTHYYKVFNTSIDGVHLTAIIATIVVSIALWVLFRRTALGLRMHAVVESPRMVELAGINSSAIRTVAWMLSSLLASLAGVLLAPLYADVNSIHFTTLLVAAIAAAVFGRLRSIPLTLLGGVLLGFGQELLAAYLPLGSVLATGLRPAFPFLVLVVLLVVLPWGRRADVTDPLANCDPPPPPLASTFRTPGLDRFSRIAAPVLGVGFLIVATSIFSSYWLQLATTAVVYGVIFLSVTVITGVGGQLSLCQATFAGIGAFTAGQLAVAHGMSILVAIVIGAGVAAAAGAVLAIPALRLGGLSFALATLGFALMADNVLFPLRWFGGGQSGIDVPRPVVGPINFTNPKWFFLLCVGILVLVAVVVVRIRDGTTGRFLDALKGSDIAARTIGIAPARSKVVALAISAGIAGLGGGLFASLQGPIGPDQFTYFSSLVFVVLVVTTGVRTVEGALNAAAALVVIPQILNLLPPRFGVLEFALFGFGAITYIKHPEGIVEYMKRQSLIWLNGLLARHRRGGDIPRTPDRAPGVGEPVEELR
jgi:ABC-type branched-subunit amino acid transport system permease subunit